MTQLTIISGGQTGVDRGALDAALALGTPCGGWCPEGRMAADGVIADHYPVTELAGAGYRARTRQNVIDSDATLIIYFELIYPRAGTEQTLLECVRAHKPYLLIDGSEFAVQRAAERIQQFVERFHIQRLNVAGPGGQHLPQAHPYTESVIRALLRLMQSTRELTDTPLTL